MQIFITVPAEPSDGHHCAQEQIASILYTIWKRGGPSQPWTTLLGPRVRSSTATIHAATALGANVLEPAAVGSAKDPRAMNQTKCKSISLISGWLLLSSSMPNLLCADVQLKEQMQALIDMPSSVSTVQPQAIS